ncbi:MAG: hypothetical protein IJL04_06405 [Bacteroidales bacterium]|nr:hypothetical protein [Bacteroidales bacterium]MBQ6101911.1 hypothetical protein [Bacteroidales bacterium]
MKKLILVFTLIASVATGFMGCKKTANDSDTHTQKYTLGENSFDINNAMTIENIKDSVGQVYNVIMLSQTEEVGYFGSKTKGVFIVFSGDFESGTYNLAFDPEQPLDHFPMYLVAECEVGNMLTFSLSNFLNQADAYAARSGSFTLAVDGNQFTVTGTGIEVKKIKDQTQVSTSSVDFEDNMIRFVLSDVVEGDFNGTNIVTAGRTTLNILGTMTDVATFITKNGNIIGFSSSSASGDDLPTGIFTYNDRDIFYIQDMTVTTIKYATSGEISVAKNGNTYTIDMTGLTIDGISGTPTMHYVGTMPKFDFPFSD